MPLISFHDAIAESEKFKTRHVLLGNGFSIACRPEIFVYGKLFEQADFSTLSPYVKKVFEQLGTQDFERVIKLLRDSRKLLVAYEGDPALIDQLVQDADALKGILVKAIASSHPEWPGQINEEEYKACRGFLANFEKVYTLNYDLLLYWAQMHTDEGQKPTSDDGFRKSPNDYEAAYVVWESTSSHKQNTFFLHGALHIFDGDTEIQKYTWINTKRRLIEQIGEALSKDLFPIFVSEGESDEKLERILHSAYLAKALRSFSDIGGCLFIHGHSLAPNDDHILRLIERGKVEQVFIGLHGDLDSAGSKAILKRADEMELRRKETPKKPALSVSYYDAKSANVWGH
jgi:hypothetical protein